MQATQLRQEFHKLIDIVEDTDILEAFFEALAEANNRKDKNDILDDLTPAQQQRLQESLTQAAHGKTTPHEAMKSKMHYIVTAPEHSHLP